MCSWCWGFAPTLAEVSRNLSADAAVRYIMGGLARDSNEPMPEDVRDYVQNAWREVAATTGVSFNWDFWEKCQPRRSTYPACRAVIAAGLQGASPAMFSALQRAYYAEARNPSDEGTHLDLAGDLGLEVGKFREDLRSPKVEALLQEDFMKRRELGVREFPSLLFHTDESVHAIVRGWAPRDDVFERLRRVRELRSDH